MLGPLSFINSSCRPNARYEIRNFAVRCINLKAIKPGKEIVVKYDTNFLETSTKIAHVSLLFYMLILWKINFRNESVNLRSPKKQRRKMKPQLVRQKKLLYRKQNFVSELKHRFKENVIVVENESSGDSSGDEISFLSYNDLHGSLELSKEVHATTNDSSESHITFSPNTSIIGLPVCSNPRDAPLLWICWSG